MKRFQLLLVAVLAFGFSTALSLPNFWYSAIAYNASGQVITASPLASVEVTVADGTNSMTQTILNVPVDAFGVFTVNVNGAGLGAVNMLAGTRITLKVNGNTVAGEPLTNWYIFNNILPAGGTSTDMTIDAWVNNFAQTRVELGTTSNNISARPAGTEFVIKDDGTVGVGTSTPGYKMDILHNGGTGIHVGSNASFSVVDIDGFSGDAALRFQKAGVGQWNTRNEPVNDDYQWFELGGGGERMRIQRGTGNLGINQPAPMYKLDVLHGGATGLRVQSSATFSVIDIDGFSGDAALRFQKAGVGQWNTRNRPADDYYEIFELGGGGSRMVIQDGTGNVGIGETTNPAYKLDVLHNGATGLHVKSATGSGSFSIIDIDGDNGDAALRFQKAGVNMWNTRNRPADDYYEIFELGGGGSRFVIQDGTGNVGIGETTSPSYKLDVLHGGATGLRVRSSSTFSVIDIDGDNGDAALRFARAGVNQWNIRNNPATDDLQFFELGGGGERMRIDNTTGKVWVNGDFTCLGVKAFTMDHPLDPTNKTLMHVAIESNEVLNSYSGNISTDASGKAVVKLPDYFESINKDFRYQLTVIGTFAQAIISKEVSNNTFEITTNQPNVKVSWEVKGVRNDAHMRKSPFVAEADKTADQKGKYMDPNAYNISADQNSKNNGNKTQIGASSIDYVAPNVNKNSPSETGGSLDQIVPPIVNPKNLNKLPVDPKGTSIDENIPAKEKKVAKPEVQSKGKSSIDK